MHKNNAVNLKINKIILAQRQICFVVVCFLLFSGKIFGQEVFTGFAVPAHSISNSYFKNLTYKSTPLQHSFFTVENVNTRPTIISLKIIAPSYYASNLGFICKRELQLDKVVVIPLRFRLGSLAYVNYLEQKPNAVNPLR